jgi:hypothetical protein
MTAAVEELRLVASKRISARADGIRPTLTLRYVVRRTVYAVRHGVCAHAGI